MMRASIVLHYFIVLVLLVLFGAVNVVQSGSLIPWATFTKNNKQLCAGSANAPCIIPEDQAVLIGAQDVNVRSITVYGTLVARPPNKKNANLRIKTAFIIASGPKAQINITTPDPSDVIQIYLTRNPDAYDDVPDIPQKFMFTGGRVLGGANGAKILLEGRPVKQIYTLLAQHVYSGCGLQNCPATGGQTASIFVTDDVTSWPVGSQLVIAPTDQQYAVWASRLAIRPGAYEGKITKVTPQGGGVWRVDLDKPIPGYNFSAYNYPFDTPDVNNNTYRRTDFPIFYGDRVNRIQAEVFILDRSLLITGDDFSARWAPLPQPPWQNPLNSSTINHGWNIPWSKYANSSAPVEGLHTIIAGENCTLMDPCHNGGGWMKMRYVRVEKAGQRGWVGRYPLHLHRMGNCPECELTGNVVYNTQQRGITIHSTGNAMIQDNIVYNMKGAGIYVEEGTEVANTIQRNVVVCGSGVVSYSLWNTTINNWEIAAKSPDPGVTPGGGSCQQSSLQDFGDPSIVLGGCRITGTDNEQADCVQQAGIWALSATNNFIGNRIANNYNCIYFQSTLFMDGRTGTDSLGKICPIHSNWGTVKGNVCHSHQRFGFYPDVNYPRNVDRSVATDGYVADLLTQPNCMADLTNDDTWCSCRPTLKNGTDNAQKVTLIEDQLDWGNGFVGQYDLADVQYLRYTSFMNNIGMYWKGSKNMNFQYGFAAHVKNSSFWYDRTSIIPLAGWTANTATYYLNTPGISGTILIENVVFKGDPNTASWILDGDPTGSAGGALGVNQQCKGYLSGVAEGQLCTPQVLLKNVDFSQIKDNGNGNPPTPQPQSTRPTWIKFGAESGNPFLGMVIAFDDSLCGKKLPSCPFRAILPKNSTHLLNLPGNPCNATIAPVNKVLPLTEEGDWSRRFYNGIVCGVQVRRLTIYGKAQGTARNPVNLILIPPGKTAQEGFQMQWMAFNRAFNPDQGPCPWKDQSCCMGTDCAPNEPRRFAEGYGAAIIPQAYFNDPLPWVIQRADGKPVELAKFTMVEFSDVVFDGSTLPGPDVVQISINNKLCTLKSTDVRLFMGQYGAMKRIQSGGSCVQEWLQMPMATPPPTKKRPTKRPTTRFPSKSPTLFPSKKPTTMFPSKSPVTKKPTRTPTKFPTKKKRVPTRFPTKKKRKGKSG